MSPLIELQHCLGYHFRDECLLRLALTHPSIAHEQNLPTPHNQRLEFLGDAVLGLVLSRELYTIFSEADEGLLTKARAKLVNSSSLAAHGRALNLGAHLVLSRGEENTGGRERASALTDAFESIVGAIFLDGGLEPAREFILRQFSPDFSKLTGSSGIENPKGELQELLQVKSPSSPSYELISVEGPDHERQFICAVLHGGVELGRGTGKSKRAAESEAASAALRQLQRESNN